ncbi:ATP-binding cassette domain-containing protein [Pseudonocardia xinjiangensis]|uniref:ATP-binding cassette domain-containing protein n=1 Tax=Pseudonocardia xinjiangensis TaxID=75289 RepID=UPI003D92A2B4
MTVAVVAEGLVRAYGPVRALDGLDLVVPRGSVCAVLGPNGAGKTTAIRVLATLTVPDAGRASVLGHDVVRDAALVRGSIGLAGQHAAVDDDLTGRENLEILGRMHHLGRREARRRAGELLDRFDLADAADRLVKTWSGGMRRRLDLIASVVVAPPVLFLDEPTTGLDPRSRAEIWTTVRELVGAGTTVLLTTQYLEEADRLADDIVIIDGGKAVATGSPDVLKNSIGVRVDVLVETPAELAAAAAALAAYTGGDPDVAAAGLRISAPVVGTAVSVPGVVRTLDAAGVAVLDAGIRRPTLDEVFLHLVRPRHEEAAA